MYEREGNNGKNKRGQTGLMEEKVIERDERKKSREEKRCMTIKR